MASLMELMDPLRMTDTGMWLWAGVLTALSLGVSYAIAMGWQRWKDAKKKQS